MLREAIFVAADEYAKDLIDNFLIGSSEMVDPEG